MNDDRAARRVLVLGASSKRWRFANKAVRAYLEAGHEVIPVHPRETEVEGLRVYPSLADVPERAALLLLYVRPEVGLQCIDEAPARGVETVFLNPGTESEELAERVRQLGMEPIQACAIVAIGRSPAEFPET